MKNKFISILFLVAGLLYVASAIATKQLAEEFTTSPADYDTNSHVLTVWGFFTKGFTLKKISDSNCQIDYCDSNGVWKPLDKNNLKIKNNFDVKYKTGKVRISCFNASEF